MQREAWQRGSVPGISAALQPAAHAVLHAREDLERVLPEIRPEDVWASAGGAASIGWHLLHLAGSTRRLLSYARGEPLSDAQWASLELEKAPRQDMRLTQLMNEVNEALDEVLALLRATPDAQLDEARAIGRAQVPVTLRGILFHVGEHAARHAGQVVTLVTVLR